MHPASHHPPAAAAMLAVRCLGHSRLLHTLRKRRWLAAASRWLMLRHWLAAANCWLMLRPLSALLHVLLLLSFLLLHCQGCRGGGGLGLRCIHQHCLGAPAPTLGLALLHCRQLDCTRLRLLLLTYRRQALAMLLLLLPLLLAVGSGCLDVR